MFPNTAVVALLIIGSMQDTAGLGRLDAIQIENPLILGTTPNMQT